MTPNVVKADTPAEVELAYDDAIARGQKPEYDFRGDGTRIITFTSPLQIPVIVEYIPGRDTGRKKTFMQQLEEM